MEVFSVDCNVINLLKSLTLLCVNIYSQLIENLLSYENEKIMGKCQKDCTPTKRKKQRN